MNRLGYLLLPILALSALLAGCSTPSAGDGGLNTPPDSLTASFEILPSVSLGVFAIPSALEALLRVFEDFMGRIDRYHTDRIAE